MSVYFIQCSLTRAVKIGISSDPWRRMVKMQSGTPGVLTLLATMDGGRAEEAALHERFSADRIRGEWFAESAALSAFVGGLTCPERVRRAYTPQNSPGKLADAVGITPGYASAFMSGARKPNLNMAIRIFDASGLKLGDLARVEDDEIDVVRDICAKMQRAA